MMKREDISIRTGWQPGDLGYVIYLHGILYREEHNFGKDFEIYVSETLTEFYNQFDPRKDAVWICEHNRRIVGFLSLYGREYAAQLRYFIVHPDCRGLGLGKELMDRFVERLQVSKYNSAYLLTNDRLKAALGLYERSGFRLKSSRRSVGFTYPDTEFTYELKVDR